MEEFLNRPIKEAITNFPKIGQILEAHGVGCIQCGVGTCLLKDIIEIHNLSEEEEKTVMAEIAAVVCPDQKIEVPKIGREAGPGAKEIRYSPPMKNLVDEHTLIKRWLALIPRVLEGLDPESSEDITLILDGVDFVRSYADRFHHAKEEDILFEYFDKNSDILKTMYEDHARGREHVKAIVEGVKRKDKKAIAKHLNAYRELLQEHIKKEDGILYPWMDRNLSMTQVGELFSKFREVDGMSGHGLTEKYEGFIGRLEEKMKGERVR